MTVKASVRNFGVLDCQRTKNASTTTETDVTSNTTLLVAGEMRPAWIATDPRIITPMIANTANKIARRPCSVVINMKE